MVTIGKAEKDRLRLVHGILKPNFHCTLAIKNYSYKSSFKVKCNGNIKTCMS